MSYSGTIDILDKKLVNIESHAINLEALCQTHGIFSVRSQEVCIQSTDTSILH